VSKNKSTPLEILSVFQFKTLCSIGPNHTNTEYNGQFKSAHLCVNFYVSFQSLFVPAFSK